MDEIFKSMQHKRDAQGNVILEQTAAAGSFFDYIQGDVTKKCRKDGTFYLLGKEY